MVLRHIVYVVAAMLPPVRRYFANLRYIPKSRITAGFVFGVGRGEALSILGQVLPNPLVHDGAADRPLDEVIGQGFALLGINVADSDAAPVAHPVWARIGARVVSIDSEGNGPAIAGRVRLRDNRFEAVLREVPQGWLLVRPDRVVAGAADSKTLAKLADEIFERIEVAPAAVAVAAE
jgi:3-(3-hydroxy-phenyl)propionate hydroxylase